MAKKIFTDESLATLVDETKSYVDSAISTKANSSHTHSISNVTNLQTTLDGKVPTSRTVNGKALSSNITLSASDVGAAASSHTHSSYVNQNAFSNVKVGSTTVSADTTTDTLELVAGSNITITPDATNDKVTIAATDTTYGAAGSSLGLVKSGGDVTISSGTITVNDDSHNHVISNVDGLQSALDAKQASVTGAASTITSSNLTANRALISDSYGKVAVSKITSTELGYLDNVSSNIQTQLDGKASSVSPKISTSIELHGATPYIDFHYGNSMADYTSRIIESSSGNLVVNGTTFTNNGAVTFPSNIVLPNNTSLKSYSSLNGGYKSLLFLDANDNVHLGNYTDGHTGNTYINSMDGNIQLRNQNNTLTWREYSTDNYSSIFNCTTDADAALGSSSYRWYRLYQSVSSISTSDEREKSDIMSIADYPVVYSEDTDGNIFEQLFYKLVPKTYTLNVEKSNDLHIGFVAQDVEKSFEELGISSEELGFINHEYWIDEETGEEKDRYGLAYEEFIPLITYIIQRHKEKINGQQNKIDSLEKRIEALEEMIANK